MLSEASRCYLNFRLRAANAKGVLHKRRRADDGVLEFEGPQNEANRVSRNEANPELRQRSDVFAKRSHRRLPTALGLGISVG
jgi:hypothetical protein